MICWISMETQPRACWTNGQASSVPGISQSEISRLLSINLQSWLVALRISAAAVLYLLHSQLLLLPSQVPLLGTWPKSYTSFIETYRTCRVESKTYHGHLEKTLWYRLLVRRRLCFRRPCQYWPLSTLHSVVFFQFSIPELLKYSPSLVATPDQPTRSSLPSTAPTYQDSSFLKPNLENFLSCSSSDAHSLKRIGNSEVFWSSLRGTFLQINKYGVWWCSLITGTGMMLCQCLYVQAYLVCISGKAGYSRFFTTKLIWIRKPTEETGGSERKKERKEKTILRKSQKEDLILSSFLTPSYTGKLY